MYDPPEGWRYGFPKPYKPEQTEEGPEWLWITLLRDGYPLPLIAKGYDKHTRFTGPEEELKELNLGPCYRDSAEHIKNAANFPYD